MGCNETDWKDFKEEGNNYFLKAKRWSETGKFNNDIIYNLILMSIEKNIMSICMKNSYLPENHTVTDLIDALKKVTVLDVDLERRLLEIEKYQNICSISDYNRADIGIKDIGLVVTVGNEVNEMVRRI